MPVLQLGDHATKGLDKLGRRRVIGQGPSKGAREHCVPVDVYGPEVRVEVLEDVPGDRHAREPKRGGSLENWDLDVAERVPQRRRRGGVRRAECLSGLPVQSERQLNRQASPQRLRRHFLRGGVCLEKPVSPGGAIKTDAPVCSERVVQSTDLARNVALREADPLVLPSHEIQPCRIRGRKDVGGRRRLVPSPVQLDRRRDRLEERLQFGPQFGPVGGVPYLPYAVDGKRVPVGVRRRVAGVEVADVTVEGGEGTKIFNLLASW
ncbi:hypothetical protein GGP50_000273 [Salinibacter ruber]|nr:hypothetical protein [Salinibacter ruber]